MFKYLVLSLVLSVMLTIPSYAEDYYDILVGGTPVASFDAGSASNACDDNESTGWGGGQTGTPPQWWKYDLGSGEAKIVTKFRSIHFGDHNGIGAGSFTLAGSNDNFNWTDIYSGTHGNNTNWEEFTFTNANAYRYHRYTQTSSYRPDGRPIVQELEMIGLLDFTCGGSRYSILSTTENDTKQIALGLKIQTSNNLNVTSLPVDIVEGTSGVTDYISKISIYLDADEDEIIDDGETLLGSTTSITLDNLVSLSGLNINNTTKSLVSQRLVDGFA